jgi:serine O-acetyltransferase
MLRELSGDALRYSGRGRLGAILHPGFRMTVAWRFGIKLQAAGCRRLAAVLRQLILAHFGCDLSLKVTVGSPIRIPHPIGIVVGDATIIGDDCTLMQHATLGGNFSKHVGQRFVPTLGDRVFVGPGAAILGPVDIADGVIIGANAVVTRTVEQDAGHD